MAEAYCVKCKAKKEMAKTEEVTMKNGRQAMQGVCPVCGTKLFRIMGGKK
jgi:Zn finger protein HypA/HybF involved in hydrogenase expression